MRRGFIRVPGWFELLPRQSVARPNTALTRPAESTGGGVFDFKHVPEKPPLVTRSMRDENEERETQFDCHAEGRRLLKVVAGMRWKQTLVCFTSSLRDSSLFVKMSFF